MTDTLPPDPGMGVKMNAKSMASLDEALAGKGIDAAAVLELCDFVDARYDCADFRLVTILKLLLTVGDDLPAELGERMKATVLGFKYWMDEPGDDGMCFWSENHQALFAVCEYLAGQLYPGEVFTNLNVPGTERRARGRDRFTRWLGHRFAYGFTEWNSNTYYEEDAAALALFIDHADDEALVARAAMVMDLLLLDMAIHRFDGHFVGSSGRCYEEQKKDPGKADVNDILEHFFGPTRSGRREPDLTRISSVVVLSERYSCPPAIKAVADFGGTAVTRTSSGLDLAEVNRVFDDPMDIETTGAFFWLMEAFTNVESIDVTVKAFQDWGMHANRFLAPLAPFARLTTRVPGFAKAGGLRGLVRLLNPATQGVAIQRANVYAFRTPHFHLSSAVHHHAGEFGDQQHIWQASLPRGINVFSTHPGAPMFDNNARNFSPSYWVGNGRMPEVGQHQGVLVALHDTRGRRGYLERERQRFTHLHFPFEKFDETRQGLDWVVGRVQDSYIGVRGLRDLAREGDDELTQHGWVTGWGVVMGSREDFATLDDFVAMVKGCTLELHGRSLVMTTPLGEYEARWRKGFWRNGVQQPHDFARYATPWVDAQRGSSRIEVRAGGHTLVLDWMTGVRSAT